jgi:exosortase/archaeosortase family protein
MFSRTQQFLILLMLGFFNPLTLFFFQTSLTFIIIVPFTLLIWFAARWENIVQIEDKATRFEMFLGFGIYAANIIRNIAMLPNQPMFGLMDMLIAFVSVVIAFYGIKAIRDFKLPTAYNIMTFLLNSLAINATVDGNLVTLLQSSGSPIRLVIDAPCTGIKGMLAYGSLAILMTLDVKTTKKRKVICTIIGLIGTFVINILRLFVIFLAFNYLGTEVGKAFHVHLGYRLLIIWIIIFWVGHSLQIHSTTEEGFAKRECARADASQKTD